MANRMQKGEVRYFKRDLNTNNGKYWKASTLHIARRKFIEVTDPMQVQHGGDHYKKMKIQPVEYIHANSLGFLEGSAIKYITRHEYKGGVEDVKKAIHFLQMLLKLKYGVE